MWTPPAERCFAAGADATKSVHPCTKSTRVWSAGHYCHLVQKNTQTTHSIFIAVPSAQNIRELSTKSVKNSQFLYLLVISNILVFFSFVPLLFRYIQAVICFNILEVRWHIFVQGECRFWMLPVYRQTSNSEIVGDVLAARLHGLKTFTKFFYQSLWPRVLVLVKSSVLMIHT